MRLIVVILCLMSMPALACDRPDTPDIPARVELQLQVLQQLQQDFKAFQTANAAYRACLDGLPSSSAVTQWYDASIELEETLAARLNRHIRKYKLLNL